MSDYNALAIETMMAVEFSVGGLQIAKSRSHVDRRERIRQAIFTSGKAQHRWQDSVMTYAEAFRECFGERLDRRAATRELPEPEGEEDDDSVPQRGADHE